MRPVVGIVCGAGLGLLAACSQHSPPENGGAPVVEGVTTVAARAQAVPEVVTIPGTVSRAEVARLATPYGGQVGAVTVAAGSRVARGQLLLTVGAADAQARLADAEARSAAARAESSTASADEERFRALQALGAVAPREYEQVHRRFLSARAHARAAVRALAAARADLQYARVRAPFDGLLVQRPVKPGDYAAPGSTLAVVVGGPAQVELQVGEDLFPDLQLGATPAVEVQRRHYAATVIERVDAADPVTRVHRVKLGLAGSPPPPFGAYAEVGVTTGRRVAVVVPDGAVVERAGLTGVFVVDASDVAHFRPVRRGGLLHCAAAAVPAPSAPGAVPGAQTPSGGCMAVIAAGLESGERVVTAPPLTLGNGDRIRARADRD